MAFERIIDLENQRYADVVSEVSVEIGPSAAEQKRARRQELALGRLRARVAQEDDTAGLVLDLLIVLGLDE